MAVITPTTFDPLDGFVRVRLGQGVPIVDADVNEREDIAMFEQRAFQKWYAGDGVPEGNDGFRIAESVASKANNFTIVSGKGAAAADALGNVGRCLVNGLSAIITTDIDFRDQPLHASQGGAVALSAKLGSPVVVAMTAPAAAGTLHLWLDVWDALWTANDDPTLLLPGLGVESCARMKRFWAVRARGSATAPVSGDADFAAGHAYYRLAAIARRAGDANVNAADVVDLRERRLYVLPSTLAPDLFNVSALDYRRGLGRPAISYRQAINALIRGQIPGTPETAIAPMPALNDAISDGIFFQGNAIIVVWTSERFGAANQVVATALDLASPEASATTAPILQVTAGPTVHERPHAVPLRDGRVVVAYEELSGGNRDVLLKRDTLAGLPAAVPKSVAGGANQQRNPFLIPVGAAGSEQVIVIWYEQTPQIWRFRRYDPTADTFDGPADLSATLTGEFDLHAAKDAADDSWVAFAVNTLAPPVNTIEVLRIPVGLAPVAEITLSTGGVDKNPFVLIDPAGKPWVFWVSTTAGVSTIQYSTRDALGVWTAAAPIPGAPAGTYVDNGPTAVVDADGGIWVFWDSFLNPGGNKDIWYARLDPVSGVWTGTKPTTGTALQDQNAVTLTRGDGTIWLLWNRVLAGPKTELFLRRLITTV
jgi:hypothetical protein